MRCCIRFIFPEVIRAYFSHVKRFHVYSELMLEEQIETGIYISTVDSSDKQMDCLDLTATSPPYNSNEDILDPIQPIVNCPVFLSDV